MKQSEIIKQLTSEELKKQLILSQLIFLLLSLILSVFLFDQLSDWLTLFKWEPTSILYYGVLPGLIIVTIDIVLYLIFPKTWLDDGGINEKVFKDRPVHDIFLIALIVAISEEFLFRGLIQTVFGYLFASTLFAVVHVRYFKKPVLFIAVVLTSFYIGYLFEMTGNLVVTITVHFIVDFLLGLAIRFEK